MRGARSSAAGVVASVYLANSRGCTARSLTEQTLLDLRVFSIAAVALGDLLFEVVISLN